MRVVDRPQRGNNAVRTRLQKRPRKIGNSDLPLQPSHGCVACGEHDDTSSEPKAGYIARSKQAVIPVLRIWRKDKRSTAWIILIRNGVDSEVNDLIIRKSRVSECELSRVGTNLQDSLDLGSFQDRCCGLHFFAGPGQVC